MLMLEMVSIEKILNALLNRSRIVSAVANSAEDSLAPVLASKGLYPKPFELFDLMNIEIKSILNVSQCLE